MPVLCVHDEIKDISITPLMAAKYTDWAKKTRHKKFYGKKRSWRFLSFHLFCRADDATKTL